MAILNTRIMSRPGNWFRVAIMLFIFFTGLALAGGKIITPETELE